MGVSEDTLDKWGKHLLKKLPKSKSECGSRSQRYLYYYYKFLDQLIKRLDREEDAIIAVGGPRGRGKSSFSLVSCLILKQMGGVNFSWDNVCHSYASIGEHINSVSKSTRSAYIVDEAIDIALGRNAMTRVNKKLMQFINKARKINNIWFWNIPKFIELDGGIRNSTVHFWIEVFWKSSHAEHNKKYAIAGMFGKDESPFSDDPWGFHDVWKLTKKTIANPYDKLKLMQKNKCFISPIAFTALPQAIEKVYKEESYEAIQQSGTEFLKMFEPKPPKPLQTSEKTKV